jgi:thiol-disulfide isomerase/thioredoxin
MKKIPCLFAAAAALLFITSMPVLAEDPLRVDVEKLGQIKFAAPENPTERKYLGLAGSGEFKLTDVQGKYIIIEVFSMYCPICQREAPKVNEVHGLIAKSSAHSETVKLVGIGAGNTPFEVDVFRRKYSVPFPLFPDDNFLIQKVFSQQVKTPTFIILKNLGKKGLELVDLHVGQLDTAEKFSKNLPVAP